MFYLIFFIDDNDNLFNHDMFIKIRDKRKLFIARYKSLRLIKVSSTIHYNV